MVMEAMKKALHLTRAGRLNEAVRAIQGGLSGASQPLPRTATDRAIDLTPITHPNRAELLNPARSEPPTASAAPSQFVDRRYCGTVGDLEYLLYLPTGLHPGMPLIVMLHGCTQSPEDFARGTGMNALADAAGVIVAYPRQTAAANPQKCWNWFRPADQQRDGGEAALIAGIVGDIERDHQVDPARIYVAGLSAGGAAAANLAGAYPELFAAVAIHSGLAHGAASNLINALSAMRMGSRAAAESSGRFVPTITFHGKQDTTVNPVNSDQIIAAAALAYGGPLTTTIEEHGKSGGRRYTRAISRDAGGAVVIEQWTIAGAGHAWSGGDNSGSYTDPAGPDASKEMLRFFLQHSNA